MYKGKDTKYLINNHPSHWEGNYRSNKMNKMDKLAWKNRVAIQANEYGEWDVEKGALKSMEEIILGCMDIPGPGTKVVNINSWDHNYRAIVSYKVKGNWRQRVYYLYDIEDVYRFLIKNKYDVDKGVEKK